MTNYTDRGQAPVWGQRSYWRQPWRSYMDTVPATTLLNAVGINFNVGIKQVSATARLLGEDGFRRARLEVPWGNMDYDHPGEMGAQAQVDLETKLEALRDNGIRPLILFNANHGKPCPTKPVTLSLSTPAEVGATQIQLDPATIEPGEIVLGKTGITASGVAAAHLITSVDANGLAHLSKPLESALPIGPLEAVTLRYEPFTPATLPDGSPNPRFRTTMDGWLGYVKAVTQVVKSTLGSEEFDVEIWNELSFGSNFLNINRYYTPDTETIPSKKLILEETVKLLRDPANGVSDVGIGNGFASQTPHGTGLDGTAIDKHPYSNTRNFPADKDLQLTRPIDGLGLLDGLRDKLGNWHDTFTPSFVSCFPEYSLSQIQTETLIYDLAPYESKVGGESHGRNVPAPGASTPSPVWVTEVNLAPSATQQTEAAMTPADIRHLESKIVLRYLASFINKGVTALDFYAANAGDLSLVDKQFFEAIKPRNAVYPGSASGGETMTAVRGLTEAMAGAEQISSPRHLSLESLTDFEGNIQFQGDGTADHPPLYNREVFAFLPFQVDEHRFVIPTYVMTRDVAQIYKPDAPSSDPTRFDMPPEPYQMTIGGVRGIGATVEATDPITGESTPVHMVGEAVDQLTVEMEVTDSPRLLTIQENPGADGESSEPEPGEQPETNPTEEPKTGLNLTLRVGSGLRLLRRQQLTARARCDERCVVAFQGMLTIGSSRHVSMRVASRRPVIAGPGSAGTANLVISPAVSKSIKRALIHKTQVRATVKASAVTAQGVKDASRQDLVVTPLQLYRSGRRGQQ